MDLLILVNGSSERIISRHSLAPDIHIAKFEEKTFFDYKVILNKIRSKNYKKVYFGCINIEYQRFLSFMYIFLLLSGLKKGAILDESNNVIIISSLKTIFIIIPSLMIQLFVGLLLVIFYYALILMKRWKTVKN